MKSLSCFSAALLVASLAFPITSAAEQKVIIYDPPLSTGKWSRQGVDGENFIFEIRVNGSYRKANFVRETRRQEDGITDRTYDHMTADCAKSTLNGKLVPARARYGYEYGSPYLLNLICDAK